MVDLKSVLKNVLTKARFANIQCVWMRESGKKKKILLTQLLDEENKR